MRFVLIVEGSTEQKTIANFLGRWLSPQLSQNVGFTVVNERGSSNLLRDLEKRANAHLNEPKQAEIIAIVALLDLSGAPLRYPGNVTTADQQYEWAKQHLEDRVGNQRFRAFFAVHEFEAWLFSHPAIIPSDVQNAVQALSKRPEQINFNRPPSKRLDEIYRQSLRKTYKKTVDGRGLFSKLDPKVAAQQCPHLDAMLNKMLLLAQQAGC